ncbi:MULTISPECIES: hypothetical protein [Caulobacter]|uniref:hypothetical protein n=1 Tax=Caulobacter TaxID=75 RepID=UPI0007854381|nr:MULTISPECIES: hypothetical protein [Caulobacter]ATC24324.1 hypothetical protein CA608_07215 [Caulobacter vibrioides]MBQ1561977.1 hypothetical protein [Caulobacter sp.]MCK5908351.1 hypothetical protein [Caulobacter sp.]PIB97079.1 hypothetical protein CSW60_21690 [Caulobacter sp. X]
MTTTLTRRTAAREEIARSMASRAHAFVVHYACEGFEKPDRRVTAIAARNLGSGATQSFEMSTMLRRAGVEPAKATPQELDQAEREMFKAFYAFVSSHLAATHWLHWNMRDSTFGFAALENRYRQLGGRPVKIPEALRVDLAARMIDLYGDNYAARDNRLRSLAERNRLVTKHLVDGAEQAAALERGDFEVVDRSLHNRVDLMYAVATKANEDTLKTEASLADRIGAAGGLVQWLKSNPVVLVCTIAAPVLTVVTGGWKVWTMLHGG